MKQHTRDVAIIGGGPAGSTMASLLAAKGHDVVLFEREKFPREHVGESLLPFCYELFEKLGVLNVMKNRYVRKPGVQFINPAGDSHTTYCFSSVIKDESQLSFHVIRADFDKLLLDNSINFGACVHEETKVVDVDLDQPDGNVRIKYRDADGKDGVICARYVVDASGQTTFMANKLKCKKAFDDLDRIAFSTHWKVDEMPPGLDEGILQTVYLGGNKKGWIFVVPLGVNRISIGVVVNNSYLQEAKRKLVKSGVSDWTQQFYLDELNSSPYICKLIRNAEQHQRVMVNGDYSYYCEKKFGDNYLVTGDASAFLDPIFASGVYMSMKSSFLLADALDAKLRLDHKAGNRAIEEAYQTIQGAYDLVGKFIYFFYNPEAFNLAEVGNDSLQKHMEHDTAYSLVHYLLAGDFFSNHKKYREFIELLKNPKTFGKYRHLMIAQNDHSEPTCHSDIDVVFSKFLDEVNIKG